MTLHRTGSVEERILAREARRVWGKHRAVVAETAPDEGDGLPGSVPVIVPSVLGDRAVWAMACVPYAGKDVGWFALPPPGAGVWVEFEGGDVRFPIWSGCYWFDGDLPAEDAQPHVVLLRTAQFSLRVDDERGEVEIQAAGGAKLVLTAFELTMSASTVSLEGAAGRKVTLAATGTTINDGALEVT